MEHLLSQLKDDIVNLVIEHTNISNNIKDFINNKNITIKNVDKITDLVTKNLCNEKERNILKAILKTVETVDTLNIKTEAKDEKKTKCKYYNRGYCKYKDKCTFDHFEENCKEFLSTGHCSISKSCMFRHPKNCRFWTKKSEGCK